MRIIKNINRAGMKCVIVIFICCVQNCYPQNINVPNKMGPMGIEVNTKTGNLFLSRTDVYVPARQLDFDISFSYNSFDFDHNSGFGNGWQFVYDMQYNIDSLGRFILTWGDGRKDIYTNNSGQFTPPVGFFDSLSQYQPNKYLLRTTEGLKFFFDNNIHKRLTKLQEPNGNFLNFSYTDSLITSITNNAGQSITLSYSNGKLSSVTDANAAPVQTYSYTYDGYGNLIKVTNPAGGTIKYSYLVNGPMASMTDENNNVADIIYYSNFAARELITCNSRTSFSYDSATRTTTVIDFVPTGSNQTTTYIFNEQGWLGHLIGNCCGYKMDFNYDASGNLIERKDGNGNIYHYTYDNRGNYLTITDPLNNVTTYSYSSDFNQVTGIIDPLGNIYTLNYNAAGNLTQAIHPGNLQSSFTYAANGDMITSTDENNNTTNILYDAYGYPQKITMPLNAAISSTFDARGNLLSGKDANGNPFSFQYDSLNRLKAITDALNHTQNFTYDKEGNLTSYTDAKGFKQIFSYDASNRIVNFKDAKNEITSFAYDAMDNLVQYTDALGKITKFSYDNQNRLKTITDALGNGYSFNYDAIGNMISATSANGHTVNFNYDQLNRIISGSDETGSFGNFTYDKNGNVTSYINAEGATISFIYDNLDRLTRMTDPLGNSRQFTYDNNDNLLTNKDRNNHISSYTYNALDRVTSFTDNNNNHINVQYDSVGNVTKLTDQNGNITNYQYDSLNRLKRMIYPNGSDIVYTYDNNDNVISKKLSDGTTISYSYDSVNRIVTKQLPNGENYNYVYDKKGRITSASNAAGAVTFTYDDLDRLTSETFNAHSTIYSYDVPNRTMTTTYPNGSVITKSYDKRSRLIEVKINGQSLATYQYNHINQLLQRTLSNGVITNYQYDLNNRLSSVTSNKNNLPGLSFQYDNEGNKIVVARTNDTQYSETFAYDANYRLTNYKQGILSGNNIPSPLIQNSYTYDGVGNRTSANLNGAVTSYTANNLNQYTQVAGTNYTYDGNGNQTYNGNFYMRYDAEGRKRVDSTSGNVYAYQYDALGRRIKKFVNGISTNYYYSGLAQIEERNATDSLMAEQTFIHPFMPLIRKINNRKYFYHQNDLGSTEAITDSAGRLIEKYKYEDFGKTSLYDSSNNSIGVSAINNTILFTGQKYDYQTNNYNFHFRNYSTATGSFSQRDPIGYAGGIGLYQYVGNNAGNLIDPLGLTPCPDIFTPIEEKRDKALFYTGELSNLTSMLEGIQKSSVLQNHFWLHPEYSSKLIKLTEFGFRNPVLSAINSTPVNKFLIPFNIGNTVAPLADLYYNGSTNNFAQNYNDVQNSISAGSTTIVGLAGTYGGTSAAASTASVTGIGGAALFAAAGLAGGLGIAGLTDWAVKEGTGESLAEIGYNQDFYVGPLNVTGVESSIAGAIYKGPAQTFHDIFFSGPEYKGLAEMKMEARWKKTRENFERKNLLRQRQLWEEKKRRIRWYYHHHNPCPPNNNPDGTQRPPRIGIAAGAFFGVELLFVLDPNVIIGPDGVQTKKWVSVNDRLPYKILFENDSTATTAVKVAKVVYPIDPKQDANTFQLGGFGFNNLTFTIPNNVNSYYQRLDVRDSLGIYVDVTAGLDGGNHQAFWLFESIDPITLLPVTDPLKGFLLKPDSTKPNAGHAFVDFSIKPLSTDHTGDTMSAYASIVFDGNDTMSTNHTKNTIDALPPTTHLNSTVQMVTTNTFKLSWNGHDDPGGSGVASYSLYVSVNGRPFSLYRSNITDTSLIFAGLPDTTYCFFIAGVDSVKNEEGLSNNCDLMIKLSNNPLPLTWLDFTGTRRSNDALLNWSTANEINTRSFIVERSLNGSTFSAIGTVNAAGNSNGINHYDYTDAGITNLGVKIIYYRIKQMDIDNRFTYSKIIAIHVDNAANNPLVSAFPNPFTQSITISITPVMQQDKTERVELYSMQGVLLYKKEVNRQGAVSVLLNDLPDLAGGMYVLRTMINGTPYTTMMVKN